MKYSIKERNCIIEKYIDLIDNLVKGYSAKANVDVDELKSYTYEHLIHYIDSYKYKKTSKLEEHIRKHIVEIIFGGIANIKFGNASNIFNAYMEAKKEMKRNTENDNICIKDVLTYMHETNIINSKTFENLQAKFLINKTLPLNTYKDKIIIDDESLFYEATNDLRLESIKEALLVLEKRERYVVSCRYGITGEPMRQADIAKKLNCSCSRITELEKRALKKLKNFSCVQELKYILDMIDEHHEDYKIKVK